MCLNVTHELAVDKSAVDELLLNKLAVDELLGLYML